MLNNKGTGGSCYNQILNTPYYKHGIAMFDNPPLGGRIFIKNLNCHAGFNVVSSATAAGTPKIKENI